MSRPFMLGGWITARDIEEIAEQTPIGAIVPCTTYKIEDHDHPEKKRAIGVPVYGVVVHKTKHFAVVEIKHKLRDSVLWVELIGRKRREALERISD